MDEPNCFVILFHSTHQALRGEEVLKAAGIEHAVINTPREFSVDCGISLRVGVTSREEAERALRAEGVVFAGIAPYRSRFQAR